MPGEKYKLVYCSLDVSGNLSGCLYKDVMSWLSACLSVT
jgi:hypothetical protein